MKKSWTGKKEITNPKKKEQHENRKVKKVYLNEITELESNDEIKEYLINANTKI